MSQITHVAAGEGERLWIVGDAMTVRATGAQTGGVMSLTEVSVTPGFGPPPHVHTDADEAYYVLDGELEVLDGDSTFVARSGSFVFIPRGTLHRFRNIGYETAKMLVVFTPAGFEEFFKAAGRPARPGEPAPPFDADEIARTEELAPRYGMEIQLPTPA